MPELFGIGLTDYQQAEWIAGKLKQEWRFDHNDERWYHYDGIRWAADRVAEIERLVPELARGELESGAQGETHRKALQSLYKRAALSQALNALATFTDYKTDGQDWDTDPYTMGASNGVIDLRNNRLIPSSPATLVTRNTKSVFTPLDGPGQFDAVAPAFMQALRQWTSDYDWAADDDMSYFLLFWMGAGMFGITPEQRFLIMSGSGRNGKGALRHAVMQAIGPEYGFQPDGNLYSRPAFGPARTNEARADLMDLRGKRIAFFSEPDKGRFNEEMLKAHTGGDMITARGLYQRHSISWEPTHSINFLLNDAPSLDDIGPSLAARITVMDFRHRFEGELDDKTLYDRIASEKDGILSILVWCAAAWWDHRQETHQGMTLPQRVIDQSREYMERSDPIARFLNERCEERPDNDVAGKLLYDSFVEWFRQNHPDDDMISNVRFATILQGKGFQQVRTRDSRRWKGVKLLSAMDVADREGGDGDEEAS